MNYRAVIVAAVVAAMMVSLTAAASASSPIDKQSALDYDFRTLVQHAQQAFESGDYEATIEYLVLAERAESEPRLLLNIARSYEELGNCRMSLVYYEAFLDNPADDETLIEQTERSLAEGKPACDDYHQRLGGRLYFDSEPRLAEVHIDGEPIGLTPIETAGLEPGPYQIRFQLDGYQDYTTELQVRPDEERIEVNAALERPPIDEPPVDEPPVDDPGVAPDKEPGWELNPVAIALAAGGVTAAATGGVIDLMVIPGVDERRKEAGEAGDADRVDELTATRRQWAVGAVSGYVAGAVLGGVGAGWLAYDYFQHRDSTADTTGFGWRIAPRIDTDSAGLSVHRRF